MLTHNAPQFVDRAIRSLRRNTAGVDFELVVVDNASEAETRDLVTGLCRDGLIDRLELSPRNTLFAEGNNIAARLASPGATHYLLLNSDVEVHSPLWLTFLLARHRRGATALGAVRGTEIADGYCFMVDADLYRKHWLDESHQWWWAVTKLQSQLLRDGWQVQAFREHEALLHHFGGASGKDYQGARGMNVTIDTALGWMGDRRPQIFASVPNSLRIGGRTPT